MKRNAKPRAVCPGCGFSAALTKDGKLHTHTGSDPNGRCPWSRRPPDTRDALALTWRAQGWSAENEGATLRRDIAELTARIETPP